MDIEWQIMRSTMKAVLLGAILGFGSIAPSLAADLPARPYSAPASYVPIGYDWTGLYVGANGGYGRAQDCLRASGPLGVFVEEGCHNAGGGVAGGQVGYRWQFGGAPMVWGLEAQGDWASLRGSHVSFIDQTITNRTKLQGFGLFTGQFGYALNNVLFYQWWCCGYQRPLRGYHYGEWCCFGLNESNPLGRYRRSRRRIRLHSQLDGCVRV